MMLFKIILAVFPFFKELFTNNKDLHDLVDNHKSMTGLLLVNVFLFILYLYAFNEARSRDFAILEAIQREKQLEEQISSLDSYYTKKLEDREQLFADRLELKKTEIDHYKQLLCERAKVCDR